MGSSGVAPGRSPLITARMTSATSLQPSKGWRSVASTQKRTPQLKTSPASVYCTKSEIRSAPLGSKLITSGAMNVTVPTLAVDRHAAGSAATADVAVCTRTTP